MLPSRYGFKARLKEPDIMAKKSSKKMKKLSFISPFKSMPKKKKKKGGY